ncbi:MAG: O-antigen ligase family protein [Acidobacteriota bacterium]
MTAEGVRSRPSQVGFLALVGYALAAPISIFASQSCLIVALIAFLVDIGAAMRRLRSAGVRWLGAGAGGFAVCSLVSAALSPSPVESLVDCKSLLLVLLPFTILAFLDTARRWRVFLAALAVSSLIAAGFGIYQYFFQLGAAGLEGRARGFFSIYMTYGQFMMVIASFAFALVTEPGTLARRLAAAGVAVASTAAVVLSYVRGAWVGMLAGLAALLLRKKPWYLLGVPGILLFLLVLAPLNVFTRMVSIVSLRDESNRDRIDMVRSGVLMIRDHPLFGLGPNMVSRAYVLYMMPGAFPRVSPHLHNNVVHLGAERGLFALFFWCLMFGAYFGRVISLLRRAPAGARAPPLLDASLAAVVSFLVAGMFDYNFGDSEVVMPVLMALAIPYVQWGSREPSAASSDP